MCAWEDDAKEVRGGPNLGYSLAQARENFQQYGVMYEPERDRRVSGPDSELKKAAKAALMAAFDRLKVAPPVERPTLLAEIRRQERVLELELKRSIKEYEQRCREARALENNTE